MARRIRARPATKSLRLGAFSLPTAEVALFHRCGQEVPLVREQCYIPRANQTASMPVDDPHQQWVLRYTREAITVNWHRADACALPARS
jgi:hypothetical protein